MDVSAARGSDPSRADTSSSMRLWFALLGGMAAYAVHLLVGFWVVPAACGAGYADVVPWVVTAATAAAAVVAAAATVVAVRARRGMGRDCVPSELPPEEAPFPRAWDITPASSTAHFVATAGVVLSALALVVVLVAGIPPLLVPPCT